MFQKRNETKEEYAERRKAYYQQHREEFLEKSKNAYKARREKILQKYCCKPIENIENYELAKADNFKGWDIHHRLEEYFPKSVLIGFGWYFDVDPSELVFLTRAEHNKIHKQNKKRHKK